MAAQPFIGVERIEQLKGFRGAVHHAVSDAVIESHHGIVGHVLEQVVERQDLRSAGGWLCRKIQTIAVQFTNTVVSGRALHRHCLHRKTAASEALLPGGFRAQPNAHGTTCGRPQRRGLSV